MAFIPAHVLCALPYIRLSLNPLRQIPADPLGPPIITDYLIWCGIGVMTEQCPMGDPFEAFS